MNQPFKTIYERFTTKAFNIILDSDDDVFCVKIIAIYSGLNYDNLLFPLLD